MRSQNKLLNLWVCDQYKAVHTQFKEGEKWHLHNDLWFEGVFEIHCKVLQKLKSTYIWLFEVTTDYSYVL